MYRARRPDALTFQTYADLAGYLWSFPRHDHASVEIATRLAEARPRELWQRLDAFLNEFCPQSRRGNRWAALVPMARDASLWDTPCASQNWELLGDAAGHVHLITGEGITYALLSAELLATAFEQGESRVYDRLWREACGHGFVAAGEAMENIATAKRAYEIVFQAPILAASYS